MTSHYWGSLAILADPRTTLCCPAGQKRPGGRGRDLPKPAPSSTSTAPWPRPRRALTPWPAGAPFQRRRRRASPPWTPQGALPPAPAPPPRGPQPHLFLLGVLRVHVRRPQARPLEGPVLVAEDAEGRHGERGGAGGEGGGEAQPGPRLAAEGDLAGPATTRAGGTSRAAPEYSRRMPSGAGQGRRTAENFRSWTRAHIGSCRKLTNMGGRRDGEEIAEPKIAAAVGGSAMGNETPSSSENAGGERKSRATPSPCIRESDGNRRARTESAETAPIASQYRPLQLDCRLRSTIVAGRKGALSWDGQRWL